MLQQVLTTLLQVNVPLLIPVLAGVLLSRFQAFDMKTLVILALYFLSPSLILDTLAKAEITPGDVYMTIAFSIVNLVLLRAAAYGAGRLLRLPAPGMAGLTLISTFTNSVNYGLPLVLLAFGQLGLDKASVYVVTQMIIVNTVGVYFAARSEFSARNALLSVFKLPSVYAALIALVLRLFDLQLPSGLGTGISMAAAAYSPVVLALLGAQLMKVRTEGLAPADFKTFWAGLTIRLAVSPLLAWAALYILHVEGVLFSVLLVLASMPVAVNAVILAERFRASPHIVTNSILWTTAASFVLLPLLIALIK